MTEVIHSSDIHRSASLELSRSLTSWSRALSSQWINFLDIATDLHLNKQNKKSIQKLGREIVTTGYYSSRCEISFKIIENL